MTIFVPSGTIPMRFFCIIIAGLCSVSSPFMKKKNLNVITHCKEQKVLMSHLPQEMSLALSMYRVFDLCLSMRHSNMASMSICGRHLKEHLAGKSFKYHQCPSVSWCITPRRHLTEPPTAWVSQMNPCHQCNQENYHANI